MLDRPPSIVSRVLSVGCAIALSMVAKLAANLMIFGPRTYVRSHGPPRVVTNTFDIANASGPFKLRVLTKGG